MGERLRDSASCLSEPAPRDPLHVPSERGVQKVSPSALLVGPPLVRVAAFWRS